MLVKFTTLCYILSDCPRIVIAMIEMIMRFISVSII